MLSDAIGGLLPAAFAVALSPIPIVAVVVVLGTRRARVAGPAFALGWIAGLAGMSGLVVLVLGSGEGGSGAAAAWLQLAIGVLFLALALKQWRQRPRPEEPAPQPTWVARVDAASPARMTALGAALAAANPKNVALTIVAAASIADAGLDRAQTAIATGVFVALGSATVAGAVLLYLVDPGRAERPLAAVQRFMTAHSTAITVVILVALGAALAAEGLAGI